MWDGLNDFPPLLPIGGTSVKNARLKLHPGPVNQTCGTGDLTARGYLQLHNLGTLLQMSYGQLFSGMDMTTNMYVQSTDFRRTIRSAGAFLLGFLPSLQKLREMVAIHVQPGTVNQAPPIGVPLTYKPCRTLYKLRETENRQRGYHKKEKQFRWLYDKVVAFFNLTVSVETPWTEIFDKFMTRGCHAPNPHSLLPCTRDGKCVDCRLGEVLFDYADWSMSEKYPPNASLAAVTPFLRHSLLDPMGKIISGDKTSPQYKIMLTFTHDSMLSQLFKAIGLSVKEWIPYASRLTFELWKEKYQEDPHHFIRVLFNGKVVTRDLLFPRLDGDTEELVDFDLLKIRSIGLLNTWTYNKMCGI
jgi:hypothetical protein